MENFRKDYKPFHKELRRFVSKVPSRVAKGSPPAVKNVKLLPRVLKPKDSTFKRHDLNMMLQKFNFLIDLTVMVLLRVQALVAKKHTQWWERKTSKLKVHITALHNDAQGLQAYTPVEVMSSGVGGTNLGVMQREADGIDLNKKLVLKLKTLRDALADSGQT